MDPLLSGLANLGGVGLLAAALLYLHREALKSFVKEMESQRNFFREEMKADRELCHEKWKDISSEQKDNHADLVARLAELKR